MESFYMWTVIDTYVHTPLDPEAVWEESQVPVWRDELGSARHSSAHSPTSKETMKKDGGRKRCRGWEMEKRASPAGFSLHETCQSNTWQRRKRMKNNYFKTRTPTCLSFLFFLSSPSELLSLFFLSASFSLHQCNLFKNKCWNDKIQKRCHSVAYQSVYFVLLCLFFFL